jgi:hypothetical protein
MKFGEESRCSLGFLPNLSDYRQLKQAASSKTA